MKGRKAIHPYSSRQELSIITAKDSFAAGDAELVEEIFRTGNNGNTVTADGFVINFNFVGNAQVSTNQDDDFDFFDRKTITKKIRRAFAQGGPSARGSHRNGLRICTVKML